MKEIDWQCSAANQNAEPCTIKKNETKKDVKQQGCEKWTPIVMRYHCALKKGFEAISTRKPFTELRGIQKVTQICLLVQADMVPAV